MPIFSISASRASCSSRCLFTWLMTNSTRCDLSRKERDMGAMSPFMLKMGTRDFCGVETVLIGPIWPANGVSPNANTENSYPPGYSPAIPSGLHVSAPVSIDFDLPSALMTSAEKYHSGAFIHLRMPDKRSHGNAAAIDATGHPQICSIDICGNGVLPRCDGSFLQASCGQGGSATMTR